MEKGRKDEDMRTRTWTPAQQPAQGGMPLRVLHADSPALGHTEKNMYQFKGKIDYK